ncbi:AI-2E family transporter [Hydrogenimonas thermophila]|uniref:Predicted PurR-regulated permease PerM n=1 Tax=Hydrogenimonas thermophila TaxID=223786 RepID=A0A1I5M564_9BACT|nr:AI-2E family transporter [Hydrogenimonas thermophila]WOE70559.1 AI-2E family transporter [Hydrogenimonas thermophila]WOE73075.1 AI-2E family transporter [Hydrogenimonas thermophila]SFP04778.1 Predicted PurR-regulated permease PerM [Hydrogenimonas thermophila]
MTKTSVYHTIVALASIVVIIAGLKYSASLIVPFLLSIFISLLLMPLLRWLIKKGIPKMVAFFMVIIFVFLLFISISGLITSQMADLFKNSEHWQTLMVENLKLWIMHLKDLGIDIDQELFFSMLQPQRIFTFALSIVKNASMMLSYSFLIFFTVVFMLLESFSIKTKIEYLEKNGSPGLAHRIDLFTEKLNHYFTLKAFTSLLTGIWISAVLYSFDVPYPLLWGLGGFMLNFIPVIGSIIAAIPPVLIALATQGYADALWIAGWFIVINVVIGNILEPKIMGKGLEISELVVFLSLVFWGWVFGKVGMLLAVPLTMVVKFALETSDSTRWIAVLLSDIVKDNKKRV